MSVSRVHSTTGRGAGEHPGHSSRNLDPAELVETIETKRTASEPGDLWTMPDDLRLPGFGETYDDCGDEFPFFCEGCGNTANFGRTCYRSACPRCAPSWARRTGTRVTAKLRALRAYRDSFKEDHQRLHHVVVSPPDDWHPAGENSREHAFEVVKELLEKCDLEGWIAYHPLKGKDGDDRGAWKERLFNGTDWDDVAPELKWAPHFHAVVVGHEVPGGNVTRELEERTGWVMHRITKEGTSVSIYDEYDLARAVTYCLSHTGTFESEQGRRAATRWFGQNTNRVTASERQEIETDAVVRAVSTMTLGIPFNSLACSETEDGEGESCDHDHGPSVDLDRAAGSRTAHTFAASAGDEWDDLAGGDGLETQQLDDDRDGEQDDEPTAERCAGRMLPISKAPPYLRSVEWCARASHADHLEEVHAEWTERDEYVPGTETADPEDVNMIEDILNDRGGGFGVD